MKLDKNFIENIILKNKNIYITGHIDADLDAIASSVGFAHLLKEMGRKSSIVVDDKNLEYGTNQVAQEFREEFNIIDSKDVDSEDSVLVILDTNKRELVSKKLLSKIQNIVIIDHHNTGEDTIDTKNLYVNKETSSASEIVVNLFMNLKMKIKPSVATALLSGIILDTNRFMIKTDVDTMRAVFYLFENGADSNKANSLFVETLNNYKVQQKVILNAKLKDDIAISKGLNKAIYRREDLAKIADTLLRFQKVEASIVIANLKESKVGMSIRSQKEDIDASIIASHFGGGGTKTEAAAKIKNMKLSTVYKELINYLENKEEE